MQRPDVKSDRHVRERERGLITITSTMLFYKYATEAQGLITMQHYDICAEKFILCDINVSGR
jgi:hypothetical protein